MSIISVSERVTRTPALLALALSLSLLTAGAASAGRTTIRGGDRIEVNQHGVTIVHDDSTRDSLSDDEHERIRIGRDVFDKGLTIQADDGDGIVRMFSDALVPAGEKVSGDVVA